jgi:uncharacterized MnhB-related membrane protein
MTMLWTLDLLCLTGVLVSGVLVIVFTDPLPAVMALSAMGTILGTLFVVLAAPDVALAEVVVGAIATPLLYLIALGKIRTDVGDRGGKPARHE